MREEAVPIICPSLRIPRPIGFFGIAEDDACAAIALIIVAPDVPVTCVGARLASTCALEPGMLDGRMIDDELGDDTQLPTLGFLHEATEVLQGAKFGMDIGVIRNVIAIVALR